MQTDRYTRKNLTITIFILITSAYHYFTRAPFFFDFDYNVFLTDVLEGSEGQVLGRGGSWRPYHQVYVSLQELFQFTALDYWNIIRNFHLSLGAISLFIIYKMARTLKFSFGTAFAAVAIFAFSRYYKFTAIECTTNAPAFYALLLGFYYFLKFYNEHKIHTLYIAVALIGYSCSAREQMFLYTPFLLIPTCQKLIDLKSAKRHLPLIFLTFTLFSGWAIAISFIQKRSEFFSRSLSEIHLMNQYAETGTGERLATIVNHLNIGHLPYSGIILLLLFLWQLTDQKEKRVTLILIISLLPLIVLVEAYVLKYNRYMGSIALFQALIIPSLLAATPFSKWTLAPVTATVVLLNISAFKVSYQQRLESAQENRILYTSDLMTCKKSCIFYLGDKTPIGILKQKSGHLANSQFVWTGWSSNPKQLNYLLQNKHGVEIVFDMNQQHGRKEEYRKILRTYKDFEVSERIYRIQL